jgi:predicted nucleic acid-binding protein
MQFVAADASPLIGLATADAFALLSQLYGSVTVTRAVKDEVMVDVALPGARELDAAMRAGWIRVAPTPPETWKFPELGAGEASTIALALQRAETALVLMDDAAGRAQATALGLAVAGVADVLLAARRARLIADVEPILERLERRGFVVTRDTPARSPQGGRKP